MDVLKDYISETDLVKLIGPAIVVFKRWHAGQTVVVAAGQDWYSRDDYAKWLNGDEIVD